MKMYVLQAKIGPQITTQAILARDDFSAQVLAVHKINANYVSDKRYAIGDIALKNPDGKTIWEVPAEPQKKTDEKKKGEK